ncbi:hypothetical protein ACFQ3B_21340 [Stackebrandtia endophytica]|uniref:hypothetical protein n=1 Tax=Stackebrandtia endophytica TaxID=1496996 RepID=UPI00114E1A87|nr:hypothetical protein [Stackebrandtia endophytica]
MKLSDRLRAVRVRAVSADETVVVQLAGSGEATVEFARTGLSRHTELSLARSVQEAVTRALTGRRKAVGMLLDKVRGGPRDPARVSPATRQRRQRQDEAYDGMEVAAESERGQVSFQWSGMTRIRVVIRQNALQTAGLTDRQWADELTSGLVAVKQAHARRYMQVEKSFYFSTTKEEEGTP